MKLLLAVLAAAAFPASALAQATLVARDVPLHGERALASAPPSRFDLVGLHWRGTGTVSFRTRTVDGRWSTWHAAAPEGEDLPDAHSAEARLARGWRLGNPFWTGASDAIQYRLRGDVGRLRAFFVSSPLERLPVRRLSIASSPPIIPRLSWGADESIRRAPPEYASAVRLGIVHHTAGSNNYTPAQSAAIVRGIELYHVQGNGWNDIGYNFLVDKYGQVFEGRYGGVDKNVVGAHALGFNTGSFGVAVLGTYDDAPISDAARRSLAQLLAWRLDLAHVDPLSTLSMLSGGNSRFPTGVPVFLRAISGHRDTGFTSCPGDALYAELPAVAHDVAAIGLPKLYAPLAAGTIGGAVRFTGLLSASLPWIVTVTNSSGATVATGSGIGTTVDWTWDATAAPPDRYSWSISAGPTLRAASGALGGKLPPLSIGETTANPGVVVPGGDTVDDTAQVTYRLSVAATVTAKLVDANGTTLATLFSGLRKAGKQRFTFGVAPGTPDGKYEIVFDASTSDGQHATTTAAVTIDRTLSEFALAPALFSPNGDGRLDTTTFAFRLEQLPAAISLQLLKGKQAVASIPVSVVDPGPQTLQWDGLAAAGRVPDGRYTAVLSATDALATITRSAPLTIDTTPPRLRTVSVRRLVFRISEPATVTISAGTRTWQRVVRKPGVVQFWLAHPPRAFRVVAQDAAGNESGLKLALR